MENEETPLWKIHARGNLINLPFWRRIRYLLGNPDLVGKPVGKGPSGEPVFPNCHGTVIYLLGKEKYIEGPPMEPYTYPLNWVLQPGRPGHVDGNLMKKILEKNSREDNFPEKGGVVGLWDDEFNWLVHSAVFSEFTDGRHIIFHQRNYKEKFEISSVEHYLENYPRYAVRYYSFIRQKKINPEGKNS
ncbi:hypothetical protein A3K73_05190 [Candidatus Pacearchaeota archaeon RBG_13_36_9]|nr:MAG: hypothetical protein A3K73_05190 [Candidatus Pacearchaeota archaeon RBG_13_36_9]